MLDIIERMKHVVQMATRSAARATPSQAAREYDVTDEGCAQMRERFAESFAAEEWDDIQPDVRRVACR